MSTYVIPKYFQHNNNKNINVHYINEFKSLHMLHWFEMSRFIFSACLTFNINNLQRNSDICYQTSSSRNRVHRHNTRPLWLCTQSPDSQSHTLGASSLRSVYRNKSLTWPEHWVASVSFVICVLDKYGMETSCCPRTLIYYTFSPSTPQSLSGSHQTFNVNPYK